MIASAQLPYFIKPSTALSVDEKRQAYAVAQQAIVATLGNEQDPLVKMVTVNSLLKTYLPYYFWAGFYLVRNGRLIVGPYQGTLGCLYIDFGRGVCGTAAQTRKTQIVEDVHELTPGIEHIACDPNSRSEIVVPVFNQKRELIAVFDVDSTLPASFDEVDQAALENLLHVLFSS
ncbi:MAG: GAF domain-containing protein [Bacteroidota bacterium]